MKWGLRHLNKTVHYELDKVSVDWSKQVLRDADLPQAEYIAVSCTSPAVAWVVEETEQELGKPTVDSVVVIRKAFEMVDLHTSIPGWCTLPETEITPNRLFVT